MAGSDVISPFWPNHVVPARDLQPDNQGYRIWNFPALRRGRRVGFRPLWSSLGRRDGFVRRKLGRRGSYAIALALPPLLLTTDDGPFRVRTAEKIGAACASSASSTGSDAGSLCHAWW